MFEYLYNQVILYGHTVLPGCIDTQTHFREPGSTDTEDLHSGSRAAIAGGITSVFEMPNTNPPTSNMKEFQRKLDLAKNRMYSNYAFYFGATADNADDLASLGLLSHLHCLLLLRNKKHNWNTFCF